MLISPSAQLASQATVPPDRLHSTLMPTNMLTTHSTTVTAHTTSERTETAVNRRRRIGRIVPRRDEDQRLCAVGRAACGPPSPIIRKEELDAQLDDCPDGCALDRAIG